MTLAARWAAVFVPITILSRWRSFTKGAIPILTWGGLRGGIAVALALSLPVNEYKPTILTITYAVVLFSIIVQGLTIKMLVERTVSREKVFRSPTPINTMRSIGLSGSIDDDMEVNVV